MAKKRYGKSRRKGGSSGYSKRGGSKSYAGSRGSRRMSRGGTQTVRVVIQQAPPVGVIGSESLMVGSTSPSPANSNFRKAKF